MNVSLTGSQGQVKDLSLNSGSVTMNFHLPQLSYNGDDTFTFQENGTTWLLRVAESSISIQATVSTRKGSATHSLGYTSFGSALSVDAKGSLHIGGAVHVSPPHIVGADKKAYAVCSGWSQAAAGVAFTCDDTKLPAAAFPYVIDPTFTTGPTSYDPDYFSDQMDGCCDSSEHWDENTWNAHFDISSIPSNAVVSSVSVGTPSWSGGPGTESQGTPDCPYNGSDWTTNLGGNVAGASTLTYTMYFYMGWYRDSTTYQCTWYINYPSFTTLYITYSAPNQAVTGAPTTLSFSVDGSACVGGTCAFAPQPGGDTLTAPQSAPPQTSPAPAYHFWTTDGSIAEQVISLPPPGNSGGNGCPVTCRNGSCSVPVPIGPPQPTPIITSVTSDSAGTIPAVIYPGVPTTIYINGYNFGNAIGSAQFCMTVGSSCNYGAVISNSQTFVSWSSTQIVETVTMDPSTPTGAWQIYVSFPFWFLASAAVPVGYVEVEPVTITYNGSIVGSSTPGLGSCAGFTCSVVVGQQITLTGLPAGGAWGPGGTAYNQWLSNGAPPTAVNASSNPVSFFWVTAGSYNVSYSVGGAAAYATFTVTGPTVPIFNFGFGVTGNFLSSIDATGNLPFPSLVNYAQLFTVINPPPLNVGLLSWLQIVTEASTVASGPPDVLPQACSPNGSPPWLDGTYPYLYGTLNGNQATFVDYPSVPLSTLQQAGETTVSRELQFNVYLMWQPIVNGASFPVPLWSMPWSVNDGATLTNGAWAANGSSANGPNVAATVYPTWTAAANGAKCGFTLANPGSPSQQK